MSAHEITVAYVRAWSEYVARCECGWTGSYLPTEFAAESEAKRHVETEAGS